MKHIFLVFCFLVLAFAQEAQTEDGNISYENNLTQGQEIFIEEGPSEEEKAELANSIEHLNSINKELAKENIWLKSYSNYKTYLDVKSELSIVQNMIVELSKKELTKEIQSRIDEFKKNETILYNQMELLREHSDAPFSELIEPELLEDPPQVTNPVAMFMAFSYLKQNTAKREDYNKKLSELQTIVQQLQDKRNTLYKIYFLSHDEIWKERLQASGEQLESFENAAEIVETTADVYSKRIEEINLSVSKAIKDQGYDLLSTGIVIFIVLLIVFIIKLFVKKYIKDNERFYTINKMINVINFTLILLVLLFSFIENVSYFVTVLGFASAGIAIAMKDWFMSMLGWIVIVSGGSVRVGDRVKFVKDGMYYVGDIIDISLLRITIQEDVTLTSYRVNKRSGRIIFVPNNYVFTTMFANYTHHTIKTVWDGIEIMITFDSNHKKAKYIAKEIAKRYAKGYTDMTRKQLNQLRDKYSVKNTAVEPRVLSFIEENGMNIVVYYLTNSYATLTLRSNISAEIVDAFNKEDDITIAYPTQRVYLNNQTTNLPASRPADGFGEE